MRKEQCTCGTELEIMPGVGEYCPNEDCPILDGPFDGSVPKAVIRAPAEPMAFVSEEWVSDLNAQVEHLTKELEAIHAIAISPGDADTTEHEDDTLTLRYVRRMAYTFQNGRDK